MNVITTKKWQLHKGMEVLSNLTAIYMYNVYCTYMIIMLYSLNLHML